MRFSSTGCGRTPPTEIFDAAININIKLLFKNLIPILLLAVVGILISAGIIGFALPWFVPLSLAGALLFGALISATDPVAVIALFNEVKAPKRLLTLIDGESIFNDATAIVLFTIFMTNPIHNYGDLARNAIPGLVSFVIVLCGGVLVGGLVGALGSLMLRVKKGDMILQFTVTVDIGDSNVGPPAQQRRQLLGQLIAEVTPGPAVEIQDLHAIGTTRSSPEVLVSS